MTLLIAAALLAGYWWCWHRSALPLSRALLFSLLGVGVWIVSTVTFVGVYADTLFWVRALQFVMLLLVAPFGLALGQPVTALRETLGAARVDPILRSRAATILTSPPVTSGAVLAMPWLIYFTGWYEMLLRDETVDILTRLLLVVVGFGYFYSRLQVDPVPRRYPQSLSLGITVVETIADGVLGLVIWQGSLIAADHYAMLHRVWGPDIRTDQTIGAGILWILGDVVGLPFLMTLFARFRSDEKVREHRVDSELSAADDGPGGLWWENDPNLRERFR